MGSIESHRVRSLDSTEQDSINNALSKAYVWSTVENIPPYPMAFDGSQWVFEFVQNGEYFIIDRQSPSRRITSKSIDADLHNLGTILIEISGQKFEHIY
jgi:hypothetical protein